MTKSTYPTKYQLEHLKKRINSEIDPLIEQAELSVKSIVADLTESAELKLAKKIKADVVIKELEQAIENLEIKQRKAQTFFGKIKDNNLEPKIGKVLWKVAEDSANYSFNKSHSISYAYLAAITVYLKFNYPKEFFLSLLKYAKYEPNSHEEIAKITSNLAADPAIREFIKPCQRDFMIAPGLIADGRDMGTVIFPDAKHKIFLTASIEERSKRRQTQLKTQGLEVNMRSLLLELEERDKKDTERRHSPLIPADDSVIIDTTLFFFIVK